MQVPIPEIQVQNLGHQCIRHASLAHLVGIINAFSLVEEIDRLPGIHPLEHLKLSPIFCRKWHKVDGGN
jgi:hypothetical protein